MNEIIKAIGRVVDVRFYIVSLATLRDYFGELFRSSASLERGFGYRQVPARRLSFDVYAASSELCAIIILYKKFIVI